MSLLGTFVKKPLGCLFSLLFSLLLLVVVIGVVGALVLDYFAVDIAAHIIRQRSGFTMTAGEKTISIFRGAVDLHDVQIINPDRFASKDCVHFNELKVAVEPATVVHQRILIDEVIVDIDSLTVVQNKDGEYNFAALQNGLMAGETGATSRSYAIKKLTLRIRSAKYFNFRTGDGKPAVYALNYDRTFENVTEDQLAAVEVAVGTDLANKGYSIFLDVLKDRILDPDTYLNAVRGAGSLVIGGVGTVLNDVGDAAKGVGETLKKLIP